MILKKLTRKWNFIKLIIIYYFFYFIIIIIIMNKKLIIFLSFLFSLVILLTLTFYFFPRNKNKDNNNSQESLIQEEKENEDEDDEEEENENNEKDKEELNNKDENLNNSQKNKEEISMNSKHQIISLVSGTCLCLLLAAITFFCFFAILEIFVENCSLIKEDCEAYIFYFVLNLIFFNLYSPLFYFTYCMFYSGSGFKNSWKLIKKTFLNKWWKILLYIVFYIFVFPYLAFLISFVSTDKYLSYREEKKKKEKNNGNQGT